MEASSSSAKHAKTSQRSIGKMKSSNKKKENDSSVTINSEQLDVRGSVKVKMEKKARELDSNGARKKKEKNAKDGSVKEKLKKLNPDGSVVEKKHKKQKEFNSDGIEKIKEKKAKRIKKHKSKKDKKKSSLESENSKENSTSEQHEPVNSSTSAKASKSKTVKTTTKSAAKPSASAKSGSKIAAVKKAAGATPKTGSKVTSKSSSSGNAKSSAGAASSKVKSSVSARKKVNTKPAKRVPFTTMKKVEAGIEFHYKDQVQETHHAKKIYSVKFCEGEPKLYNYFATAGSNSVMVYKVAPRPPSEEKAWRMHFIPPLVLARMNAQKKQRPQNNSIQLVQAFLDEEESEIFYSCDWASTETGEPLVCAAGLHGALRVINVGRRAMQYTLLGHGHPINEVRTHPLDDGLVFTASKDKCLKMWNVQTGVLIATFGGDMGHRDEVLSMDIHVMGNVMVSSSIDTSIKVWNLMEPQIKEAIRLSYEQPRGINGHSYKPILIQEAMFHTYEVHGDYVDNVRWYGDNILSKSTKNRVCMWQPDATRREFAPMILREFDLKDSSTWFFKMDVCVPLGIFGVGNMRGKLCIYALQKTAAERKKLEQIKADIASGKRKPFQPDHLDMESRERFQCHYPVAAAVNLCLPRQFSTVRQVTFSRHCRHVVCSTDDGRVSLWNIKVFKGTVNKTKRNPLFKKKKAKRKGFY